MNPPITISKPPFTYTNNTLFISSGNNQHRRATLPELKDLFNSSSASNTVKDPPAHWYEAQLRFYGLDVSKTKAVAKMRLFDAVRGDGLVVPGHIKEIEEKMEKEWKTEVRKQSRVKKKEAEVGSVHDIDGKGKGKRKRNADDIDVSASGDSGGNVNVDVSVTVTGNGNGKEKDTIKAPTAKKARPGTGPRIAAATKKNTAVNETEPQNTTRIIAPKAKAERQTATQKNTAANANVNTNTASPSTSTSRRGGTIRWGRGGLANVTSSGGRMAASAAAGSSPPPPPGRPRPIQTARRSRPFPYPGRIVGPPPPPPLPPPPESATNNGPCVVNAISDSHSSPQRPRPIQTARRSRPFPYPGRTISIGPSTTSNNDSYSDPPPPYSISQENHYNPDVNNYRDTNNSYSCSCSSSSDDDDDDDDDDNGGGVFFLCNRNPSPSPGPVSIGPLGLLNGRYSLECSHLREGFGYDDHPFTLILALQHNTLWGAYDFGMFTGILRIPQRPWEASADKRHEFSWRGRENGEGVISYDDTTQKGWIRFLGNGRIDGVIEVDGKVRFSGVRISGEQTRSERDAASMKDEWEGYNEEAYEYARVARWR